MPLIETEPQRSPRTLLLIGLPVFITAFTLSLLVHQYTHVTVKKHSCGATDIASISAVTADASDTDDCAEASFAGIVSTFILAVASFAFFIHYPRSLFLASMALVNATSRIPKSISVFLDLLIHQQTKLPIDESVALKLIHLKDPTASLVILCFYTLTLIFLTITIIHDIKTIRWKWPIAITLLLLMSPLESVLLKFTSFVLS
jgi:hypothetical protein